MTSHFVCLSLGSNLGNRRLYLFRAMAALKQAGLRCVRSSVILETEALLRPNSPEEWNRPFLNVVLIGQTDLSVKDLGETIQRIERSLGREPDHQPWSPRTIDIDILLYDDLDTQIEAFILPHQGLLSRPFFLALIAALCPDRVYPKKDSPYYGKTFTELSALFPLSPGSVQRGLPPYTQIVGIVNITDNSMSDGGLYLQADCAVEHAKRLVAEGASVIDLGAQATNPRIPRLLSPGEEWNRLAPVLERLAQCWNPQEAPLVSIDTFYPDVIRKALAVYPIKWINDVSGGSEEMAVLARDHHLEFVLMHSLSIPPNRKETLSFAKSPVEQIVEWASRKIESYTQLGLAQEQIILDPGLGFGTTPAQAMQMMQRAEGLKDLGCRVLIGHSRKSYLTLLGKEQTQHRDLETVGMSVLLQEKGIEFLRVHNVRMHQEALSATAWFGVDV